MSSISIGLSGLLVSQKMIDLTGQNVANTNTPGYHRQVGDLSAGVTASSLGTGVELKSITRVIDQLLENAIVRNTSSTSQSTAVLDGLNRLQAIVAPGEGSLHDALTKFFSAAEKLSTQPDDITMRREFLNAAGELTGRLNTTTESFRQMRGELLAQANTAVDTVNALAEQIAGLNQRIHDVVATGGTANMLLDQRDAAISKLSELVDVRIVPQDFGEVNLLVGGTPIVLNSTFRPLSADLDPQGQLFIHVANAVPAIDVTGGKLGGILSLVNTTLPSTQAQFNTFAQALAGQIDHVFAGGLGLSGPLTSLTSQRPLATPNLPLGVANLPFPVQGGDLYITMTNLATGQRTLNKLSIDPATQSMTAVAGAISTIPNLQAVVDPQAGTLNIIAAPGFGFDFTGSLSSSPDAQAIAGTTTPTIFGAYSGNVNDTLNYTFVGSGTIGSTAGLALEVRNGAGTLLTTLNVGQGYEPGTNLPAVLGVQIKLTPGTVNNGDTFSINVAANTDTVGLLPALGLNTLFVGDSAADLQVNQDLLDHPEKLALSKSGLPGDGVNLAELIALRDQPALNGQTQTFQRLLEDIIGNVGTQAQDMESRKGALDALAGQLEAERQSVSGIDPNEELMRLVQYQRSYQLSARFIVVVNQTLDEVLNLVGN